MLHAVSTFYTLSNICPPTFLTEPLRIIIVNLHAYFKMQSLTCTINSGTEVIYRFVFPTS